MRTASEILDDHYNPKLGFLSITIEQAEKAINEARKESIEECVKVAKTKWDFGHKSIESAYVDKESILSLIKQLK